MKNYLMLLFLPIFLLSGCTTTTKKTASNFAEGTKSLPRANPEDVNVSPESIEDFFALIEAEDQEFHSVMILRNGKVIAERWWGDNGPEILHPMHSVTKSFTATAVGFAIADGLLTIEDKVISFFPDKLPEEVSLYLSQLSVWDLLTMSVGHESERRGDRNSEDWIKSFLEVPFAYEPGTKFHYNSMASFMLSAIVQKLTGEKIFDYLTPRLLEPLGIENILWEENPQGISVGGSGMRLKTEDMAKFGQLFLQNGMWNGEQLLPQGWVEEASSYQIANSDETPEQIGENPTDWNQGYAYQMWRTLHNGYRADGARGQEIVILPDYDLVVVYTANFTDLGKAFRMMYDTVLPGVK